MITHAHTLSDRPPIFAAPFGAILAGLVSDVPRYEREKALPIVTRGSPRAESALAKQAAALHTRILDVIRNAPLVLAATDGEKADVNTIADAVGGKRSTVYKALYYMLDLGTVIKSDRAKKSVHGRRCVEWGVA